MVYDRTMLVAVDYNSAISFTLAKTSLLNSAIIHHIQCRTRLSAKRTISAVALRNKFHFKWLAVDLSRYVHQEKRSSHRATLIQHITLDYLRHHISIAIH